MVDEPKYPMHTLSQARHSLELLKAEHIKGVLGVAEYRSMRDFLQSKINEFEAKEKK
jgi:hypothetical protein